MNKTLAQIEGWLNKAKEWGYGTMEFTVSIHDFQPKVIEMKAKNGLKEQPRSVTKRIIVHNEK